MKILLILLFLNIPVLQSGSEICYYQREMITGFNKICYYQCLSGTVAINIGSLQLCPLTIRR